MESRKVGAVRKRLLVRILLQEGVTVSFMDYKMFQVLQESWRTGSTGLEWGAVAIL